MATRSLKRLSKIFVGLGVIASALTLPTQAIQAAGDLLVAPTRIILDGQRGTEDSE